MIGEEVKALRTKDESYGRSIRDINGNYNSNKHTTKTFMKNGKTSWEFNTGNVSENTNPLYEDLMMSEEIWLNIEGKNIPVTIDDSSFQNKTYLSGGIVNYSFKFKEASDKAKNII
jgi:hypothetical protein